MSEDEIKQLILHYPELKSFYGADLCPGNLVLADMCKMLHKSPATWVGVSRLIHTLNVKPVRAAKDVRPGDLISMTSQNGPHIGVVLEAGECIIAYGTSEDEDNGPGGVRLNHGIRVVDPDAGLEKQEWEQRRIFAPKHDVDGRMEPFSDGVWRLRVLENLHTAS